MADVTEAGAPPEGFAFLPEELRFENALQVSRVTAFITSQSFLFTAAAIGRGTHWLLMAVWAAFAVLIHVFRPEGGGM